MNKKLRLISFVMVLFLFGSGLSYAATITIAPTDTQTMKNTYPFGGGNVGWTPYHGFIYKNLPAFNLQPGDILAFDLGIQNEIDIQLDIAMAPTTVNGGTVEAGPFTTVVTNTQTPQNPRGDTTLGNFELRFTVEQPFSFPGGGLIIRFSNPSASYATDTNATHNLVAASTSDSSGYFAGRFYSNSDGVSPWDYPDLDDIGGFQIITQEAATIAVPTITMWGMIIFMVLVGLESVYFMRRQRSIKS